MRRIVIAAALLAAACNSNEPAAQNVVTDTRAPIAIEYVGVATMKIHARPSDDAKVVSTYTRGETVSVLARQGDWAEVSLADGSGWVHAGDLATAVEAQKAEADNLEPHFIKPPAPVTQPGAHGDLVFDADVDTEGNVVAIRTLKNTTGSAALESSNKEALQHSQFTPVVRHGKRERFIYQHRVHY